MLHQIPIPGEADRIFGTSSVLTAFLAMQDKPATKAEIDQAKPIADRIFGVSHDDHKRASHLLQAICLLRIRNAAIQWTENAFSLSQTLAVFELYSYRILKEHGIEPVKVFRLPESEVPDHELARDAIRLLVEVNNIITLAEGVIDGELHNDKTALVRMGARLMRLVTLMEARWFNPVFSAGMATIAGGRTAKESVHGTDRQVREKYASYVRRWDELRAQGHDKTGADREVARELSINPKTVFRARREAGR